MSAINRTFNVSEKDRVLSLSDLSFDLSVYDLFGLWLAGGCVVLPKEEDIQEPREWINYINRYQVSIWNTVPMRYSMLVEMCQGGQVKSTLDSLKLILLSGDWVYPEMVKRSRACCPKAKVISLGGATEASIWSIYYEIDLQQDYSKIPYGYPLLNQTFYVCHPEGELCSLYVPGELWIGGEGVATGYFNDQERTSKAFIHHEQLGYLYKTGDWGYWAIDEISKRKVIYFLGREDAQVKVGGYRIELGEVERAIRTYLPVESACVVTIDRKNKKELCAYYVLKEKMKEKNIEKYLKAELSKQLSHYMVPNIWISVEKIPLTPNGKINKKALPDPKDSLCKPENRPVQTEVEKQLAMIWSEVLSIPIELIYQESDFFALGGHSLKAINVMTKIQDNLHFSLPLIDIFKFQTLSQLAKNIERLLSENNTVKDQPFTLLVNCADSDEVIVLLHPGLGTIDCYFDFSRHWPERHTIIAFEYQLYLHANTLPELALIYLKILKEQCPNKQYHFFGYSLGGQIAFEMVKLLEEQKRAYKSIAIFDAQPIVHETKFEFQQNEQDEKNALREALKKEDAYSEELFDNYYKMRKERGDSLRQIMKNYETIGKLRGSLGLFTVLDTGKNIQDSSLWQQHVQEKIYHYGQFNCDHFSLFSHNNTQEIISVYREFLNGLKHK